MEGRGQANTSGALPNHRAADAREGRSGDVRRVVPRRGLGLPAPAPIRARAGVHPCMTRTPMTARSLSGRWIALRRSGAL